MLSLDLTGWLSLEIFRTLLVFTRMGAAMLMLPGFGEPGVPARIRIMAGLGIAVAVSPMIEGMPVAVPTAWGVILAVVAEAFSGALLGALSRTVISGVLTAGQIIGQNIGMANILAVGVSIDQAATVGATVYAGLIAVLFASGAHHTMLRALVESYHLLPPGQFPSIGASAHAMVMAGVTSMRLAGQLALPFLLLGLVFNIGLAAMNRALPSMPVFMIGNPALVVIGLYLLAASVPGVLETGMGSWADLSALLR